MTSDCPDGSGVGEEKGWVNAVQGTSGDLPSSADKWYRRPSYLGAIRTAAGSFV